VSHTLRSSTIPKTDLVNVESLWQILSDHRPSSSIGYFPKPSMAGTSIAFKLFIGNVKLLI
jgi:hypothetical protein